MSKRISTTVKAIRYGFLILWGMVILLAIGSYLANPGAFTAENIAGFLQRFSGAIWVAYFGFSVVRGLTLLPSTPLVLAGTLLFPEQPFAVLIVSMLGILLSSSMIYWGSELMGFDEYFENKKPELIHRIRQKLEHPLGLLFVAAWAFFPLVPTDAVCYVAGTTRMSFPKFIAAVGAGEVILCTFYVFSGGALLNYLR